MLRRLLILIPLSLPAIAVVGAEAMPFTLSSRDVLPGRPMPIAHVFNDAGCAGGNRSPSLEWRGAPVGTKSFAITMFDLDERRSPSGWWHWVLYDVPATISAIAENAGGVKEPRLPAGTNSGRTDLGNDAYHGPCPGKGEPAHRYLITIYALSVSKLPVPPEASGAMVSFMVRDYALAKATLTATYAR